MRKTPPTRTPKASFRPPIKAHGLPKNLVACPGEPDAEGIARFAVVASRRGLAAVLALAENGAPHG